jgi:hypothetical protein
MTLHIATAAVVKVSIGGAGSNSVAAFVRRGEIVPEGVDKAQLKRLRKQGFIAELEEIEPEPEPVLYTQEDVDAAVQAAEDAKDAELADARRIVEEKAVEVAAQLAEIGKAQPADVTLADGSKPPTDENGVPILSAAPDAPAKRSARSTAAK